MVPLMACLKCCTNDTSDKFICAMTCFLIVVVIAIISVMVWLIYF